MDEDADTYLLPKKFKVKFSNELFKYSSLTGCNNPDKLLAEWTAEHKKRASVLPRKSFLHWQIEQTEFTKQLSKIYKDSLNDDTAVPGFILFVYPVFAGHSQQTEPKIEKLAENSFVRVCVEEILTWFWSSEKLALVYYYNGKYPEDDKRRIEAIYASRGEIGKGKLKRPTTAVSLSNLARFRIRRYFEEKQGVLFNDSWLVKGTAVTTSQIRNKILNLMGGFHREIDETLIPYLPIAGKKKRSTEITLSQECTKSAHNSIRAYLDLLTTSKAGIKVECKTQERKLVLPLDKIKDDLKAPIVELARNERIRFSADEISNYIDECARIVDKTLSSDEFQKNPIVVQFSALIYNEPIASNATENYLVDRLLASRQSIMKLTKAPNTIESGIFVIDMAKVWEVLQERGHTIVQKCSRQIRECFHDSVSELQKEFVRFKKILNFRSMDPTTMLKNKTEVNELSAQDIPKAVANLCDAYDRMHKLTQLVQFDPREHEYLINVANLRRALPRHVADHNLFFQRRLHIFAHYVRKRQTTLEVSAQNALNQMKVLNNFTNPDEVENYLAEMRVLKPLILTLHQELVELNEQEKVVNLPPLSLNEIQVVGSQVNNLWSLFDWTKRFYDFKANFYKRRRTEVRVQECQMFLDTFIETLMDLSVKLESQRATKVFLSQLKTEIEKFRHNIPVLEVMSCARLGARHWEKMSEIVGFNLALYENATVAQIAELNLNLYIAKLKPIAFVADREGQISDQANFITDYWTETSFTMDITHFWGIHVPSNLETLIKSASEHVSKIKAYREPDNEKSFINQSLDTWIKNLNNLLNLLKKWNVLLKCWKRISNVMRHSYLKVPDEFEHFRQRKQGGGPHAQKQLAGARKQHARDTGPKPQAKMVRQQRSKGNTERKGAGRAPAHNPKRTPQTEASEMNDVTSNTRGPEVAQGGAACRTQEQTECQRANTGADGKTRRARKHCCSDKLKMS
ncbi:Dynein heavy chain, cytoplasmic [Aphelenchoides bicaudatus]|nr:Dynein heavy chain, cytoplasmic [Aphelenchoides bicaudatus]